MTSQDNLLSQLRNALPHYQKKAESISKSGIDWHIDHCLKVICNIGKALIKSEPQNYHSKFNSIRFYILTTGHIPRGKGKAPKITSAIEKINLADIEQLFMDAESIWKRVDQLPWNHYFTHPFMGDLKKKKTLKFLRIHTKHHLKIIQDIIKA